MVYRSLVAYLSASRISRVEDGAFQGSALIGYSSGGVEAPPSFIYRPLARAAPSSPPLARRGRRGRSRRVASVLVESPQEASAWSSSASGRSSQRLRRVWSCEERSAATRPPRSSPGAVPRALPGVPRRRRRIKAQLAIKRAGCAGRRRDGVPLGRRRRGRRGRAPPFGPGLRVHYWRRAFGH